MIEHELKFLVDLDAFERDLSVLQRHQYQRFDITQHYLQDKLDGFTVRIRSITELFGLHATRWILTMKHPTSDVSKCIEIESQISKEMFMDMLEHLTIKSSIRKVRIEGPWNGVIDVFPDNLSIYEIENPPKDFEPPNWCKMEITADLRYRNMNLGTNTNR